MNNEELNVFLDTISENGTPETLENVLKTKNYIGELNDKITNLTKNESKYNSYLTNISRISLLLTGQVPRQASRQSQRGISAGFGKMSQKTRL